MWTNIVYIGVSYTQFNDIGITSSQLASSFIPGYILLNQAPFIARYASPCFQLIFTPISPSPTIIVYWLVDVLVSYESPIVERPVSEYYLWKNVLNMSERRVVSWTPNRAMLPSLRFMANRWLRSFCRYHVKCACRTIVILVCLCTHEDEINVFAIDVGYKLFEDDREVHTKCNRARVEQ